MARIDKNNFAIFIVTYDRPLALNAAIRQYLESIPFRPSITVISNHTECQIDPDLKPYVEVIFNTLRPNESFGYLARSWNHCFQLGLRKYEWLLCSQDDVIIKPGWFDLINKTNYEFYLAPLGDTRFLLSRKAFRRVGWFDERFVGIGHHEHDYILRVINLLPHEASVFDKHAGGTIVNPIGLENFWFQPEDKELGFNKFEQRTLRRHAYLVRTFVEKWGFYPDRKIRGLRPSRLAKEIDWYPYISAKYKFLELENPQYDVPLIHLQRHWFGDVPPGVLEVPGCPLLALCYLPAGGGQLSEKTVQRLLKVVDKFPDLGIIFFGDLTQFKDLKGELETLRHSSGRFKFIEESTRRSSLRELLTIVDFSIDLTVNSPNAYEEILKRLQRQALHLDHLERLEPAALQSLCAAKAAQPVVLSGIDPENPRAVVRNLLLLLWRRLAPRTVRSAVRRLRSRTHAG